MHWLKKLVVNDPWLLKKLFRCRTIGEGSPYMTRLNVGKYFLHVFWRTDVDPDCHDHPWDFWTFPLYPKAGYYEEVAVKTVVSVDCLTTYPPQFRANYSYERKVQRVPGWAWTFRPAEHTHRVLYPASANGGSYHGYTNQIVDTHHSIIPEAREKQAHWPVVTFVIKDKTRREWGFLKNRDDKWCWVEWKSYVFGTAKDAPC